MASWAAVLALTGFRWSAVTGVLELAPRAGRFFWSSGSAWGSYTLAAEGESAMKLELGVAEGEIAPSEVRLTGFGARPVERTASPGQPLVVDVERRT
jgi:hypothetical protein